MLPLLSFSTSGGLVHFLSANWILVVLSILPALYWYGTRNHDYWTKRGIKSPKPVPFLGSFFSVITPLPVLYDNYLKKYGKVFGVFNGQTPQLVIADPDLIKRILVRDFHLFRNRPGRNATHRIFSQNLVAARNEQWKRIRSILTPMFTSLKLKKMEDLMQACVSSLLNSFDSMAKTGKSFEARDPMGNYTLDVISKCAFATETDAHSDKDNVFLRNAKGVFVFRKLRTVLTMLVPKFLQQWLIDHKLAPFHVEEFEFFEKISRALIQERRGHKGDKKHNDMLQLMVNAEYSEEQLKKTFQEDLVKETDGHHLNAGAEELEKEQKELNAIIGSKHLSEEEIMAQAMVFFLAGYETTASTLSYCLFELATNPDVQERLYKEIQQAKLEDLKLSHASLGKLDYLDAVISETLRKYPPALIIGREANEDYEIPELKLTIPKDNAILIPIYAMHHSEEFFPEPEKWNPDRFMPANRGKIIPYSYIPFGGGPRNCIGMRFALTEAKMGLARVLDKFQVVRVGHTTDRLTLLSTGGLLKTSPIDLGVKSRSA